MLHFKVRRDGRKRPLLFSEIEVIDRELRGSGIEHDIDLMQSFCQAIFSVLSDDQKRAVIGQIGAYDEVKMR